MKYNVQLKLKLCFVTAASSAAASILSVSHKNTTLDKTTLDCKPLTSQLLSLNLLLPTKKFDEILEIHVPLQNLCEIEEKQ